MDQRRTESDRGKKEGAEENHRDDDGTYRLDFGAIYGTGAVIGFGPREIDQWSLAELFACIEGWRKANCPDGDKPPTMDPDDFDQAVAEIESRKNP